MASSTSQSTEGPSWFGRSRSESNVERQVAMEAVHKKRLAMILRYIATMHHSASQDAGFVRNEVLDGDVKHLWTSDFFSQIDDADSDETSRVLFSTSDFARLVSPELISSTVFSSAPFSFYAADSSSPSAKRKRTLAGTIKDSITILSSSLGPNAMADDRACWLRLTRVPKESPPAVNSSAIREYLTNWKARSAATSFKALLTLDNLKHAPKLAPGNKLDHQDIKSFLRRYKKYLIRKKTRTCLEPMYNQLFEWLQQHGSGGSHEELVWGFGNARFLYQAEASTVVVNGPLLEILVEVELARDGALLVRPRQHTGVSLNRQVVSAIAQDRTSSHETLSTLYKSVAEMETTQISPGQPTSYTPFLKRMAVQLAPNGSFASSSELNTNDMDGLVVTDAWCLFCRPKPSTVWARDASNLADQLLQENMASASLSQNTLPRASWALTHGVGALEESSYTQDASSTGQKNVLQSIKSALLGDQDSVPPTPTKPLFALPTSDSQDLIADLLLSRGVPAVVCEGPPGTGKTHTIANIVCAYLCQGKRVCVTSKGAPALSVLRQRLPPCVQELCVDVSMSESMGMRQLQQTVERLADRVSCVNTDVQTEKCRLLKQNIDELEDELLEIDKKLESHSEAKRRLLTSLHGQELAETSLSLISSAPWLMKTAAKWTLAETKAFCKRAESILKLQEKDPIDLVDGFSSPAADALVSSVAANAGVALSAVRSTARKTVASIPGLGSLSGLSQKQEQAEEMLGMLRVNGEPPQSKADWQLALAALNHGRSLHFFHNDVMNALISREGWPLDEVYSERNGNRRISQKFMEMAQTTLRLKQLASTINAEDELKESIECGLQDSRRTKITARIQVLAESMVEATVVTELRRTFSVEAQSSLIKFAQVAGKTRFNKSSLPSKMSQRQRRHRQEYLDAFERCVRYTPCWILTSSQISDYLPSESGLFDLVVIDEASQSDITVLPGMLRGKQWLIVGDGKQVSPTESFISEAQIDSLKASLPESPVADSLLPGQSFFDLCAHAFPRGRVVLSEHFRCAPEIISFSNSQFYDGRLVPLRLPTTSERMTPSIVDVRVNGSKVGKINEKECDTIVSMIQELVDEPGPLPRSIGVISLIGDEQSRLIRGRVLDAIGPAKYKEHDILIGDPPTFQGAERDVIFLSLVCSVGSVPTQNQQMHAQRANVALSRARDRMVLVRSVESSHIPNGEDVKGPIIDFFVDSQAKESGDAEVDKDSESTQGSMKGAAILSFRDEAEGVIEKLLTDEGFSIRRMGVVWNDALCVENADSGRRAAVCVDCAGESREEWKRVVGQQKSIERVGWQCLRVDALSVFVDLYGTMDSVKKFLAYAGVEASRPIERIILGDDEQSEAVKEDEMSKEEIEEDGDEIAIEQDAVAGIDSDGEDNNLQNADSAAIVVISSDDDEGETSSVAERRPGKQEIKVKAEEDDGFDPEQFGDVVDLAFLKNGRNPRADFFTEEETDEADLEESDAKARRGKRKSRSYYKDDAYLGGSESDESESSELSVKRSSEDSEESNRKARGRKRKSSNDEDDEYLGGSESDESEGSIGRAKKRRRRYRRLDKYSRDGRWYPGRKGGDEDEHMGSWYDTDSDLAPDTVTSSQNTETACLSRKEAE